MTWEIEVVGQSGDGHGGAFLYGVAGGVVTRCVPH